MCSPVCAWTREVHCRLNNKNSHYTKLHEFFSTKCEHSADSINEIRKSLSVSIKVKKGLNH